MHDASETGGGATPLPHTADVVPGAVEPAVADAVPGETAAPGGLAARLRPPGGWSDDTGDVPGWVLVTLMTAGLVIALWAVAGPALSGVFQSAIERVTSFGG